MTRPLRIVLVNLLTLLGCALGLAGVYMLPDTRTITLLALSVVIDAFDGHVARKLDACTALGARFDWCVDTCMSYAIVYRLAPSHPIASTVLASALIATQSVALAYAKRFSGRTIVTALAIGQLLFQRINMNTTTGHLDGCTCAECTALQFTHGLNSPPPSTGQMIESLLTEQYQGNGDTPTAAPPLGIPAPDAASLGTPSPDSRLEGRICSEPIEIPAGTLRLVPITDHRRYMGDSDVILRQLVMSPGFTVCGIYIGPIPAVHYGPGSGIPSDAFSPSSVAGHTDLAIKSGDIVHVLVHNHSTSDATFLSEMICYIPR